jgi:hypothetical protein
MSCYNLSSMPTPSTKPKRNRCPLSSQNAATIAIPTNHYCMVPLTTPGAVFSDGADNACSVTTNHIVHQQAPTIFFWTYWQRLLRVVANSAGQLYGKLGNWRHPGGQLRRRWNSYFDYHYKFLYRSFEDHYIQYELFDTRFINGCATPWKPND